MDTFEYIRNLARIREAIPDELKPSWVRITTITMVCKGHIESFDVERIKEAFRRVKTITLKPKDGNGKFTWRMMYNSFYNQVTIGYRDMYSAKAIKLFPNGSIQVAGCSNILDCRRVCRQLEIILSITTGKKTVIPFSKFMVVMINSNFSFNSHINLYSLYDHLSKCKDIDDVVYDPGTYSGLKVKLSPGEGMKRVSVSIFSTGNVLISGAETLEEVYETYRLLNKYVGAQYRFKKSEDPKSFEVVMGARFDEWVRVLNKM